MLRADEQMVFDYLEECGGMEEIEESVKLIKDYRLTNFYPRKTEMLCNWQIDHQTIYDLIVSVFTSALTNRYLTMQALVGMLNHKIKLDNEIERVEILSDLIGLISTTGLIDIHSQPGEYHTISTGYSLPEEIPIVGTHATVWRPEVVKTNWTEDGSVILGHRMNHHTDYVRLSHINKMNEIPMVLNQSFISRYAEAPKNVPVTEEQIAQWKDFQEESVGKYREVGDNAFYGKHYYCTRGRCYNTSYYLSPQGSSYKKSIIELRDKEVVHGFN